MKREIISFRFPALSLNIRKITASKTAHFRDTHFHNAVELVKINSGKITCRIKEQTISLSSGNVLLINSAVTHNLVYSEPVSMTYMQINIDKYLEYSSLPDDSFLYKFIRNNSLKNYFISNINGELFDIFNNIEKECNKKLPAYDVYIKSHILALTAFMYRNELLSDISLLCDKKNFSELIPSIEYIDKNYNIKLSLDEIAEKINADRFRFCRLFKAATGSTAFEYINFVRLHMAEMMLTTTKKSIAEIAFDCGFASIQYFNRTFKEYHGHTPKEHKNQFAEFSI